MRSAPRFPLAGPPCAAALLPFLFLWMALASATAAFAEPLGVGDRIEPAVLEDQHGEEHRLGPEVDLLLFTRDMDAGDLSKEALSDTTGEILAERGIVYVSDIHGMPGLIARMFAIPSMRRRPYPMLLDREGEITRDYPGQEGKATLLRLDDLEIQAVEYLASSKEIRDALGLAPAEESE